MLRLLFYFNNKKKKIKMKENAQYIIDNYSEVIIGIYLVMSIKEFEKMSYN